MVSATIDSPKMDSRMNNKSPRTIPAETAMPFATPNVVERVITKTTLALGTAASAIMIPNRVNISKILIIY